MEIKAEGIARTFFRKGRGTNFFYAVNPTDLTLRGGTLTAVVGKSGSGKTTLANMLCGLLRPTEGRVLFGGEDVYAWDDRRRSEWRSRKIGVVPQVSSGLQSLTVLENVVLPSAMYGGADRTGFARELLKTLGVAELSDVYAGELSGGEARRMAVARALINVPELIVADEPTGDLDPDMTRTVFGLLRNAAEKGAAVLLITHEENAAAFADRVFVMEKGSLVHCED